VLNNTGMPQYIYSQDNRQDHWLFKTIFRDIPLKSTHLFKDDPILWFSITWFISHKEKRMSHHFRTDLHYHLTSPGWWGYSSGAEQDQYGCPHSRILDGWL